MTEQHPLPEPSGANNILRRIGYRRTAIAIMLVGAAGFVAALLVFGEQLLCLSGSTLVTLGGLALLITARRLGLEPAPVRTAETEEAFGRRGKVPPALQKAAQQRSQQRSGQARDSRGGAVTQIARPVPVLHEHPTSTSLDHDLISGAVEPGSLADRVIVVLESQNARVIVEQAQEGRAIFRILLDGGEEYVAMVLENGPAGTPEGRALLGLVSRYAGGRGYLISQDGFLPETYQWASGRGKIRLVSGDELDELGV